MEQGSIATQITDSACVKNVAVFGDRQAAHRLILFDEPVKKLGELALSQRLLDFQESPSSFMSMAF